MIERGSRVWMLLGLMVALPGLPAAAPADEPSLPELKERFAERYPKIRAYKAEGKLGETWEGYLAAVKGRYVEEDEKLGELIRAENRDRTLLYRIVADEEDTDPSHVARRSAIRNFKRAEVGRYLRDKQGQWYRKPDEESS
jgi:uncharacterized protein YdbL (DUF1318 family)